MRKRIKELADGRIECTKPIPEFSSDRIEIEVFEGADYQGEFTVKSKNQVPIRGLVYASNPRMECLTTDFNGTQAKIAYRFHSTGLMEGDIQKGDFSLVCNQGEYNLSFAVVISKPYETHTTGMIRRLDDFVDLAKEHWQEAKTFFFSPGFATIFKPNEVTERLLYEGILQGKRSDGNIEEFLLACRRKEPVTISAEASAAQLTFDCVKETLLQKFLVSKNTWGFVEFDIISDAPFIRPQKNKLTTDDFLGSEAMVGFYLCPEQMHAGRNYGRLTLKNIRQEIQISICARRDAEGFHNSLRKEIGTLRKELLDTYIDYRLKKIATGRWAFRTLRILDDLIVRDTANIWYRLIKAQTYLTNGQRQECEWILEEFKRKCKDKSSPQWGYYLYICTLLDREELYISRLTEEIEQIFLEHKDNFLLFWCLLFLRENYEKNPYQKLRAIEKRVLEGEDSPILYAEAYCLYRQEPYLLHRISSFEIRILNWARKQHALTNELAEQMISVFPERMACKLPVLWLLEECSEIVGAERLLPVACGYLIRNQKYGKRYFHWYEKGVEAKIRITGLYEAYLLSMDTKRLQELPKVIQLYFKYNNQLSYKQKAVLYVNIIAAKNREPKAYEQHYAAMEKFAWEQITLGHIDDDLAIVYEEALSKDVHYPEIWDALSKVLFVHRLTCLEPEAARVIILQKQLKYPRIVPLTNGVAYFPLYSNEYSILVEDTYGNRYSGSIFYQLEKLMYPARYLRTCMKHSPQKLPYLLYYFANRNAQEIFEEKDLIYFKTVMESEEIDTSYQSWLFPKMCRLLLAMDLPDEIKTRLKQVDLSLMAPRDRGCILEICIEEKLYEEAYQIVEQYGYAHIPVSARVRLLNYQIHKLDFAEEETLLQFCADTFLAGKYNDAMLSYLCRYYQGPLKTMISIFESAISFDIAVFPLAERILLHMLYTEDFLNHADEIYQSYEECGNKQIKEAYLTLFSHNSFVNQAVLPDHFFRNLQRFYINEGNMNEACELTLLKYYADNPIVLEKSSTYAETLLVKYLQRGMYFAFFKKLGRRMERKYQLYDKYYIEYHGKGQVWLHYTFTNGSAEEADYITEEMAEVYEGIFVKRLVLFYGEEVQYYISEDTDGKMEMTESGILKCSPGEQGDQIGRYERLNEMIRLAEENNADTLFDRMQTYRALDCFVDNTFTIIT